MDAGDAGFAGLDGAQGLGKLLRQDVLFLQGEDGFEIRHEHLPQQAALHEDAVLRRDEDDLHGLELDGHLAGHVVGIHAIRFAVAIKTQRRDDGDDALSQQDLEQVHIHALDFAGEEVVHALQDAERMGDDGIGAGGAEVVGGEAFEDFVGEAVGGVQGELQGGGIGDASAVDAGGFEPLFFREDLDLGGGPMHEHDADVQGTQHGDIEQQRGEILIRHDGPIQREDKRLFAELRNVLQDAPQIGRFHYSVK